MGTKHRGSAWVGTSGWVYKNWRGLFYPQGLALKRQLAFLSEKLHSVEINGTFYSLGRPATFAKWRKEVPPHFLFAIKGSRFITHMKKLKDPEPLANFFAQGILELGPQIGPILWQLPAMFPFMPERAETFFATLPRTVREAEKLARRHDHRLEGRACVRAPDGHDHVLRHALEIRHPSWLSEESLSLLRRYDIALVTADTVGKFPFTTERTGSFAYVRLHGARVLYHGHYTPEELEGWAARLRRWLVKGDDVFVYFDNTDGPEGAAPLDAQFLASRLSASIPVASPRTKESSPPRGPGRTGTRRSVA